MGFPFEHGIYTTLIAMRLADRLGLGREDASQTYYACLLAHAGCTTEAHVAAEVFGGSLTTSFNPVMYGSGREVLTGLLRALPDPGSPVLVRAVQTARRYPRMAREQRPALTARDRLGERPPPPRPGGRGSRRGRSRRVLALALQEADPPVGLEHGPLHLVERGDRLLARLGLELLVGEALAAEVVVDQIAALDEHDRLPLEQRAQPPQPEVQVRGGDREDADGQDRHDSPRQRVVALGHALLDEVTDDDEQDDVERLERAELALADHARHEEDERVDDGSADDDVHGARGRSSGSGARRQAGGCRRRRRPRASGARARWG